MDNERSTESGTDKSVIHDASRDPSIDDNSEQPEAAVENFLTRTRKKWVNKKVLKPAAIWIIGFLVLLVVIANVIVISQGISLLRVSGPSMEPTLSDGDAIVLKTTNKVSNDLVVVFRKPPNWSLEQDQNDRLIKRIVAVPGDTFSYDGKAFSVNGETVYKLSDDDYQCNAAPGNYSVTLNSKQILVMGDNAKESLDSRSIFCSGDVGNIFLDKYYVVTQGELKFKF